MSGWVVVGAGYAACAVVWLTLVLLARRGGGARR
jgi:hypothetical protein